MQHGRSGQQISDLNPERVLLLGDSHGDAGFIAEACAAARRNDCPVIVQVGDFGFWSHTRDGQAYLQICSELLGEDLELLFLDGNHENHTLLRDLHTRVGNPDALEVSPRVTHLARGTRWSWHGRKFAALGGAGSVDRKWRTPGHTWWPEEVLTESDLDRLGDAPLEVLLCHDNPSAAAFIGTFPVPPEDLCRLELSRQILDRAIETTTPSLVVHGHWHRRHSWRNQRPLIESLASNIEGFAQAAVVLHIPTLLISRV